MYRWSRILLTVHKTLGQSVRNPDGSFRHENGKHDQQEQVTASLSAGGDVGGFRDALA